jgi:hypothetical protein
VRTERNKRISGGPLIVLVGVLATGLFVWGGGVLLLGALDRVGGRPTPATGTLLGEAAILVPCGWVALTCLKRRTNPRGGSAMRQGSLRAAIFGGVATAAFSVLVVDALIRRLEGSNEPAPGPLLIIAVVWALLTVVTVTSWRRAHAVPERTLASGTATIVASLTTLAASVSAAAFSGGLIAKIGGQAKPHVLPLLTGAVATILLVALSWGLWKVARGPSYRGD